MTSSLPLTNSTHHDHHPEDFMPPTGFSDGFDTPLIENSIESIPFTRKDTAPARKFTVPEDTASLGDVIAFAPKPAHVRFSSSLHQGRITNKSSEQNSETVDFGSHGRSLSTKRIHGAHSSTSGTEGHTPTIESDDQIPRASIELQSSGDAGEASFSKNDGVALAEPLQDHNVLNANSSTNEDTSDVVEEAENERMHDFMSERRRSSSEQIEIQDDLLPSLESFSCRTEKTSSTFPNQQQQDANELAIKDNPSPVSSTSLNRNYRVGKAVHKHPKPGLCPSTIDTHNEGKMPSEEELLIFLMQRNRHRDKQAAQALEHHKLIQCQKDKVLAENESLQDQLNAANGKLEAVMEEKSSLYDKLHLFTTKYQKIKKWALEMNQEYAIMRQQGDDVNASLSTVGREKLALEQSFDNLSKKQSVSQDTLTNIQRSITEQRVDLTNITRRVDQKTAQVEALRSELLKEVGEKRKLESHIVALTQQQGIFNKKSLSHERKLTQILQSLTDRTLSILDQTKDKALVQQVLQVVQQIAERSSVSPQDLQEYSESFKSVIEKIGQTKSDLIVSMQTIKDSSSSNINTSCLKAMDTAVRKLMPELEKLNQLETIQFRLEEQGKKQGTILQDCDAIKHLAEARESELRKMSNKLVDEERISQQQTTKVIQDLERRASNVSLKWIVAAKSLEKRVNQLAKSERHVTSLGNELEQVKKQNTSDLARFREEIENRHRSELDQLEKASADAEQDIKLKHTQEVKSWSDKMNKVQLDFGQERDQHHMTKKELQAKVETAQEDAKQAPILREENKKLEEHVSKITEELKVTQEDANKVGHLEESIRTQEETIAGLQRKESELYEANKKLESLIQECRRKDDELDSLKAQIALIEKPALQDSRIGESIPENEFDVFFAQTQDTVLSLKTQVFPEEHNTNVQDNSEGEMTAPPGSTTEPQPPKRRVADRSGGINPRVTLLRQVSHDRSCEVNQGLKEQVIIPDSQHEAVVARKEDEMIASGAELLNSCNSSSDLTELSEDHESPVTDEDDVYNIPHSSPNVRGGNNARGHYRAMSVASQESMLLQATPGGRKTYRDNGTSTRVMNSLPNHTNIIAVQHASLAEPSPARLRNEAQGRSSTPFPEAPSDTSNSRPQSNSAVKRRSSLSHDTSASSKRLKRAPANLQLRPVHTDEQSSVEVQTSSTFLSDMLPDKVRTTSKDTTDSLLSTRGQRKQKQHSRKSKKDAGYAAKFTSGTTAK